MPKFAINFFGDVVFPWIFLRILLLGIQIIQVIFLQEGVDNISSINPLVIVSNYHVDLV
jgi:hypothetical protein